MVTLANYYNLKLYQFFTKNEGIVSSLFLGKTGNYSIIPMSSKKIHCNILDVFQLFDCQLLFRCHKEPASEWTDAVADFYGLGYKRSIHVRFFASLKDELECFGFKVKCSKLNDKTYLVTLKH